ncbi:MAG: VTT domain-containing protein, partial [Gloeobacteraceae cyanobacterium ES-bin-144]|nr:VTT domain-containing protein [Verrucomicrobiales bacterium]
MPGSLVLLIWGIWGGRWAEQFTFEGSVIWLENTGSWAWLAGALLLSGDLIFPVPGTIVISALGFIYGALLGGLIATVSMVIAGFLGYGIGRLCSERFACRLLGEKDFHAGRQLFIRRGGWVVALSRALPILPEVISCTAGLVRMPVGRFALALTCGSLPTGFLFAAIGNTGK